MTKRAVIYARLSVTKDESVSVERQLNAARSYAQARGWSVVGEFVDDGVSATSNKPEVRSGWRAVLDSPEHFEAVIVWKVDRLARRVIDFLHADEALRARGAGLVAVEDPVDMTTPQGRAFATVLAVFGELEAAAISARVKAARDHLIAAGRVVGGTVPYGWRSISNPDGPGMVLAQDPARIGYVQDMAAKALAGESVYSIKQWLDVEQAPLPISSQTTRTRAGWAYSTVERLLRNPVLAGMTPYQPGRGRHDQRDPAAVLRDGDGLPVVDESVAILTTAEHRRLVSLLDDRDSPQAAPRAAKGVTSPLLSGLVLCGTCDTRMHRGTTQGRPSLTCRECYQTISRNQLDPHVISRLLRERGDQLVTDWTEEPDDNSDRLAEIEAAISDVSLRFTRDDADVPALTSQLEGLKAMRSQARTAAPAHRNVTYTDQTVLQAWEAANDDIARRSVLAGQVETITINRGKTGRYLDPARVEISWRRPAGIRIKGTDNPRVSTFIWTDTRPG